MAENSSSIVLGYWDIRGLAEPIRMLLRFCEVDFEDKRYALDREEWNIQKEKMPMDFPNLPYLMIKHEDFQISESIAVLTYLGERYNLMGKTLQHKAKTTQAISAAFDLLRAAARVAYAENLAKATKSYLDNLPVGLSRFNKVLSKQSFVCGEEITAADFFLFEVLEQNLKICEDILEDLPNLQKYLQCMRNMPQLQYLQSEEQKQKRFFHVGAHF